MQEILTARRGYGGADPRLLPIYSVPDVAHHLGVPASTVRSWVKGGGPAPFVRVVIPADGAGALLSFQNLVEIHVLNSLRGYDVPLPRIRKAIAYLRRELKTDHPLADVEVQTDGGDIVSTVFGFLISLTKEDQLALGPILEPYLKRIDRDVSGVRRLYPFVGAVDNPARLVAIDPFRKFGKPYLVDLGVETSAVAGRFRAGESIKELAADFDATTEQIEGALRFERVDIAA